VLTPRGGLHGACTTSGDLARQLAGPLLDEIGSLLGQHLPIMDVAQILNQEIESPASANGHTRAPGDWSGQVKDFLDRARPLVESKGGKGDDAFLLVPASQAGKALVEAVQKALPDINLVRVAGQSDLMICREQGGLTATDLRSLFKTCQAAYEAASPAPASSPHARFDILDWMPLEP